MDADNRPHAQDRSAAAFAGGEIPLMVTTAEPDRIRQARELLSQMDSEGLKLVGDCDQSFPRRAYFSGMRAAGARTLSRRRLGGSVRLSHLAEISELRASLAKGRRRWQRLRPPGGIILRSIATAHSTRLKRVASFARELPPGVKLAIAPEIEAGVRDLAALSRVSGYLLSAATILKPLEASAREVESL